MKVLEEKMEGKIAIFSFQKVKNIFKFSNLLWFRSRMCSCIGPWLLSPNISQKNPDEFQNSGSGMDSQPALCLILSLGIKLYLICFTTVYRMPQTSCASPWVQVPQRGGKDSPNMPLKTSPPHSP